MGTTPNFAWPYPELTDPPDGATQMKTLANAADASVKTIDTAQKATAAKVPFAIAAGKATIADRNPDQGGSVTVTYPVGRFTQAPVITTGAVTVNSYAASGTDGSTSLVSFVAKIYNPGSIVATGCAVHWLAVQMTSSSGPGRAEPAADTGPTVDATCHTPDCANAGHTITVPTAPDIEAVICGVCGQPITDIAPA